MLPAAGGDAQGNAEEHNGPDKAGDAGQRARKLLDRQGRRIEVDTVHTDAGEHQHDEDELGEAAREQHGLNQEADALFLIDIGQFLVGAHGGAHTATENHADTGRDADAQGCEREDLDLGAAERVRIAEPSYCAGGRIGQQPATRRNTYVLIGCWT